MKSKKPLKTKPQRKYKSMKQLIKDGEKVFKDKERIPEEEAMKIMEGLLGKSTNGK